MNSSLVKMLSNHGLFKLTSKTKDLVTVDKRDKMKLLAGAGEVRTLKDDQLIEDGIVSANQTVIVRPATELIPTKYHALVSYNVELALNGIHITVLSPIVSPGENKIGLLLKPSKKVDLSEFSHIFELYQID